MLTNPVAGAFVFHAAHGHFHFPFAFFGLYVENPDGSIGAPAAVSQRDGFCIADSFIYDSTLPHAGAFGNWGSCADPTSLRGLSVGAVDEYDRSDPGQSIPIPNLPDGNYWLRSIVDPNNFFIEGDKSNNETDAELTIVGNTVTVHRVIVPVLARPPVVTLETPGAGVVSGTTALTAHTLTTVSGVKYLVDGLPFAGLDDDGAVHGGLGYDYGAERDALAGGAGYRFKWENRNIGRDVGESEQWRVDGAADSGGHWPRTGRRRIGGG